MITRRALVTLAAAILVVPWRRRVRYGSVDVDRHRQLQREGIDLRVIHRGEDVTARCFVADDTGAGIAHLFRHRDGRPYLDPETHRAAVETIHGIEFRRV
jgi:hypothetical protein